ncbi:MAG: hypothetical protein WBP93_07850 [Pyrinomonadaceae bacterium]
MRNLLFTLVGILCLCYPSAGQDKSKAKPLPDQEESRIREAMNIPPTTAITFVPSKVLPDSNPFKVYGLVISELEMNDPSQATHTWVEAWNKRNASKYGSVEAATNISQAEVIFLWFVTPLKGGGDNYGLGPIVSVTSYLIVQKATGLEIVWRERYFSTIPKFSTAIDEAFKERMKVRAKALKK